MKNNDIAGVTGLLTNEHKALLRALSVLSTMTEQVEHGTPTNRHDVNALLIFFHYFGDVLHQAKEESILFPALKAAEEFTSSPQLEHLFAEHNEQRGLSEKAQFALFTDKQDEFVASARKVIDLLSEHMREEDRVLFPQANRILEMGKENEVTAALEEADARFGFSQRRLLMDMLRELENKYMPRAA